MFYEKYGKMYRGIKMFCKNCGTEMNDTARFCPKCGFDRSGAIQQKREIVEDNKIRCQVKPEFNIIYKLLSNLWKAIIYMFFICFLFTNLYKFWSIYPVTLLWTIGIMLIYVVVKMILENMQYKDLEYNFYATKIEYKDGFLNKEEKELKYKYIREVTMNQNILERICGIGTIRIYTNASSGSYGISSSHNSTRGRNGIYIHCVEDVQEQYRTIKQIIDEGTPED